VYPSFLSLGDTVHLALTADVLLKLGYQRQNAQRIAFPEVFQAALKLWPSSVYAGALLFEDLVQPASFSS
jgi:hypothetical protein